MSAKDYYARNVEQLTKIVEKLKRQSNLISMSRLSVAIIAVVLIVYIFKHNTPWLWACFSASILLLLFLIKLSSKIKERKTYKEELLKINQNETKALSRDFSPFEHGKEFSDPNHSFSYDLDLFGEKSIFQMLNRTCTLQGKDFLAKILTELDTDKESIVKRQEAIIELKDKIEWRQSFHAIGQLTSESLGDKKRIDSWLKIDNKFFGRKSYSIALWLIPVLTIISWVMGFFGAISFIVPIAFSSIQFVLTLLNIRHINLHHGLVHKSLKTLRKYHSLIKLIENEGFNSDLLNTIKRQTFHKDIKPSNSFSKLIRHVNGLDNRTNILLAFVLNCLFLSDINYVYRIEKWIQEFRSTYPFWINAVARFDALSSLACFMYNNPGYAIPEVSDSDGFVLNITDGGHPLLGEKELVTNNVIQNNELNLFLITGANMAGKSTFLRMTGINLILAMSGTCVCATRFRFTPVKLYTSMRTNDSLQTQTSFFFAELKRLKFIVEKLKSEKKTYILLDEILKGTNSKDQHTGSARLIENIISLDGFGMIATHDVELTTLETIHNTHIKNIAFEIEMEKDKMIFDYKYKDGVCTNMNATILMEQMNIFQKEKRLQSDEASS